MTWVKLPEASKEDESNFRKMKKPKFYADEDIEDDAVRLLRSLGANVQSARELGFRGKPDSFHSAYAYKKKRFLITKNGKHYLNNREIPFHSIHGIVIISGDWSNRSNYITVLVNILLNLTYSEVYEGAKIEIGANDISLRRPEGGKIVTKRVKFDGADSFIWED
jgi:hypothetical protein